MQFGPLSVRFDDFPNFPVQFDDFSVRLKSVFLFFTISWFLVQCDGFGYNVIVVLVQCVFDGLLVQFDGLLVQFDGFLVQFDSFLVQFDGFSVQFDDFSVQKENKEIKHK